MTGRSSQQNSNSVEEFLAPVRARVKELMQKRLTARDMYYEAKRKAKDARTIERKTSEELAEIYRKVEEAGIPRVLIGGLKSRYPVAALEGEAKRTVLKPSMLGEFGPIEISAPHRHGNHNVMVTLMLECDGVYFKAKRIDEGGIIREQDRLEPYEVCSHRLSDVTTKQGWIETKDAAYAILHVLGRVEDFPLIRPVNDESLLLLNGEPIIEECYELMPIEEEE